MKLGSQELRAQARLWHGSAPSAWAVRRFKQVAAVREGQVDPGDDKYSALPLFAPNHIESGTGRIVDVETADGQGAESGKYLVDAGNVLYSKIRPALRKVALAPCAGLCSADMYPIKPGPELDARFLFYSMLGEGFFRYSILESARVAMPKINREALGECVLLVPTRGEQCAIVDFLDRKTAAIDALIEKKQKFALLLAEKRQAIIRQVVTKGLDLSVPMKDSGVTSLGDIPAHWKLVTLRRAAHVGQGDAFAHDLQGQGSGDLPWFKVADMNRPGNEIDMISADNFVDRRVATEAKVTIFPAGAVIFPRVGAALLTNKRRVLTRPSVIDDNTYALVPNDGVRSRFLYLRLLLVDMASVSSAGLVPTVTFAAIKDLAIALPPLPEQDRIARRVETECAALDALVTSTNRSVDGFREYRQALITAAVTGQLDVAAQEAA